MKLLISILSFVMISNYNLQRVEYCRSETLVRPICVEETIYPTKRNQITSRFGFRNHPIDHVVKLHKGIDFAGNEGDSVFVTDVGIVEYASDKSKDGRRSSYGKHIIINHNGHKTLYAHLSEIIVKKGQYVERGELIGRIGSTGKSTRPHLHYEYIVKGKSINPIFK